jgi:hypothetical protein
MNNNQNNKLCCGGLKNSIDQDEITTDGHIYYLKFSKIGMGNSIQTIERPIKGCPYCLTPLQ